MNGKWSYEECQLFCVHALKQGNGNLLCARTRNYDIKTVENGFKRSNSNLTKHILRLLQVSVNKTELKKKWFQVIMGKTISIECPLG